MENNKNTNYDALLEKLIARERAEYEKFVEAHKDMPPPKFQMYDLVTFNGINRIEHGFIEIIDRYGTFEQNEEASYDIYVPRNNTLYKHIREHEVIEKIRDGKEEEITQAINHYNNQEGR